MQQFRMVGVGCVGKAEEGEEVKEIDFGKTVLDELCWKIVLRK